AVSRAGLDKDVEPGPTQPRDHLGDECHPVLAGRGLLEYPYLHARDLMASGLTDVPGRPAHGRRGTRALPHAVASGHDGTAPVWPPGDADSSRTAGGPDPPRS